MNKIFTLVLLCLAILAGPALAQEKAADAGAPAEAAANPHVVVETTKGQIVIELYPDKAPITVKNFLNYVNTGFYDDTIFHRIVADFVIQGGGFDQKIKKKPTNPPITNEANNGLSNDKYTISMARLNSPHTATSQFFISTTDNPSLNPGGVSPDGYAVFGKVVEGMDVIDTLGVILTTNGRVHSGGEPEVLIKASVRK